MYSLLFCCQVRRFPDCWYRCSGLWVLDWSSWLWWGLAVPLLSATISLLADPRSLLMVSPSRKDRSLLHHGVSYNARTNSTTCCNPVYPRIAKTIEYKVINNFFLNWIRAQILNSEILNGWRFEFENWRTFKSRMAELTKVAKIGIRYWEVEASKLIYIEE